MQTFDSNEFLNFVEEIGKLEEEPWEKLKEISSPMITQYVSFKEAYKGHIVFFQLGDFYETYADDARLVSRELNAKLTSKTIGGVDIPMCGFPAKSGYSQANQLAKDGYKVAVISQKKNEQDEIERFMERIITPSSITDEAFLSKDEPQYLLTAYQMKDELGIVLLDTLSGEQETRTAHHLAIFDLLSRYQPKEAKIYLTREWEPEMMQKVKNMPNVELYKLPYFYDEIKTVVKEHKDIYFQGQYVPYSVIPFYYFMIKNLEKTGSLDVTLRPIHYVDERDYLYLHQTALKGLELLENAQSGKKDKTLFALLNQCVTPKGSRMLKI